MSDLSPDRFSSEQLGRSVYRLTDVNRAREALQSLSTHPRPLMLDAKVPTEDVAAVAALTALGFQVIDTGIQLDVNVRDVRTDVPPGVTWRIREAAPSDREAVERVSEDNLTTSRFHLDPRIDSTAARNVKRAWVGNFFDGGRGGRLLVAEGAGGVGGLLLTLEQGAVGVIDLVALDPDLRGTKALAGLVAAWLDAAPGLTRLIVGTQVSNVRSLRAYARLGFRVCGASYVLHYHA